MQGKQIIVVMLPYLKKGPWFDTQLGDISYATTGQGTKKENLKKHSMTGRQMLVLIVLRILFSKTFYPIKFGVIITTIISATKKDRQLKFLVKIPYINERRV